ncbi:MAG TPA: DUF3135 domain-containing protein [Gammaproteobacteria bacterium]|nr:DUF3135 domain-containing protein [Gammaproteobacteria bacterium]
MSQDDYEFPFDFWAKLAAEDPASFEEARQLMIDSLIESAPPERQPRLRGLQWQIDQVRARTPHPMGACVKISNMMWDKLLGADGLVEHLERLGSGQPANRETRPPASVIPLRPPH